MDRYMDTGIQGIYMDTGIQGYIHGYRNTRIDTWIQEYRDRYMHDTRIDTWIQKYKGRYIDTRIQGFMDTGDTMN